MRKPAHPPVPGHEASTDLTSRELVLKMYVEFDEGRLDRFRPSISPDFAAHVMGNQSMDWEGFVEFGSQFLAAFPDGRHTFEHIVVEGGNVVTVGRYRGTHEGELMGVAPTHREIDLTVMHLDRVQNGQIVEHRGIGNGLDLLAQLGVSAGG
ncbi:MAG: ester cyclase [Acidobacteriota bacterium]